MKKGNGKTLSSRDRTVKANYFSKKCNSPFPESTATVKICHLDQLIPGLSLGMHSMKEGEIRKIFIHPEYAYGSCSTFEPCMALEVTIELLEILPDKKEIQSLQSHALFLQQKTTQNAIEELILTYYYALGWKLWNHLRFGSDLFSKEALIFELKADNPLELSESDFEKKINHIHWLIYQKRSKSQQAAR